MTAFGESRMKILVTGAKGFAGRNLVAELRNRDCGEILEFDLNTDKSLLDRYTQECGFVFHLAGVNRPEDEKEFMDGNFGFTSELLNLLKKSNNKSPVLMTSSIQAKLDNPYGKSKKAGENILFEYGRAAGVDVYVYRLANMFGKWSRPNYNTVVATFCHNISRNLEIRVDNPDTELHLCYIDDVLEEFMRALEGNPTKEGNYCIVPISYRVKLGQIAAKIREFAESRKNLNISDMGDDFTRKLYSTYLSFLPKDDFAYPMRMNTDGRGSFTEFIKTTDRGQVSINVSRPGITKGNHWHHTKTEKFLVVSGQAVIRFRKIDEKETTEYHVSGDNLQAVDIPPGYTHSITNTGNTNLVTVIWANEIFNPEKPDTHFMEV
mgnify:CR=1 FL=1